MSLIRFVFNFILFGALFYLIWHFFPDAFTTLVSWIKVIIDFVTKLAVDLYDKVVTSSSQKGFEPPKSLLVVLPLFLRYFR